MLNHEEIKKDQQRITKIKTFINKNRWEGINFPSEKYDWKKFALNVLYAKKEKIYLAYVSKHNSNREKQVTLLMISNGKNAKLSTKDDDGISCSKKIITIIKKNYMKKLNCIKKYVEIKIFVM